MMTSLQINVPREATADSSDSDGPLSGRFHPTVWLVDSFCFTPWYTAELSVALVNAGIKLRLLCADFVRERNYFRKRGLVTDGGPLSFLSRISEPAGLTRAARTAAVIANTSRLCLGIKLGWYKPDVLHLQQLPLLNHGVHLDLLLVDLAQMARIPVIYTVHNVLPHDSGERFREVYGRLYRRVDRLVCHSRAAANQVMREFQIPASRIRVIPHGPLFAPAMPPGIEDNRRARRTLCLPIDRQIVLWHGVLAPYKGLDTLLLAWRLCLLGWRRRFGPEPLLVIAGTGPRDLEAKVAHGAADLGSSVRTDLRYIPTEEVTSYYAAADLLVYPYHSITTSGALLTGLSACKPIVASDLECFRDYLVDGNNARLVEPGSPYELAAAFLELLVHQAAECTESQSTNARETGADPYARMKEGAASNRERYTGWSEIGMLTVKLYEELV